MPIKTPRMQIAAGIKRIEEAWLGEARRKAGDGGGGSSGEEMMLDVSRLPFKIQNLLGEYLVAMERTDPAGIARAQRLKQVLEGSFDWSRAPMKPTPGRK